jgi:hypothetical protein
MNLTATARRIVVVLWATAALLCLVGPIRSLFEGRMVTHMLLQFPLLFVSGWMTAGALRPGQFQGDCLESIDAHGLLAVAFTSCTLAFWMVPNALDLALLFEPVRWAKYLSLWLAGLLMGLGRARLSTEVAIFLLGMLVWMMATAGLLYQTLPQRLCVSYLLDEQRWTGLGLVAYAVLLGLAALWRLVPKPRSNTRPRNRAQAMRAGR